MYNNPFSKMSLQASYEALRNGAIGPIWPGEELQKGYTGICGPVLLKRAFDFIGMLEKEGVFDCNWKGLDYGCGWGRFLSAMLSKGTSGQMDGCDAWQRTLDELAKLNYQNYIFKVPELLSEGDLPNSNYSFIMSFSVFTHLSPLAFDKNIPVLMSSLKKGGALYITVRHEEFIEHKYKGPVANQLKSALDMNGIAFVDSGGDLTGQKVFGDTIVTGKYMDKFGKARYLGQPHSLQHVYEISR